MPQPANLVIGIITVNLNNCTGLQDTIISFNCQDYPHKKLFIVDGCSNDGSINIISQYSSVISNFLIEKDTGIYDAMNKGFKLAHHICDYLIFLNTSDLFFSSSSLSDVVKCIQISNTFPDLVVAKAVYTSSSRKNTKEDFFLSHKLSYVHVGSPFCHQASLFKSTSLPNPPYEASFKIAGDYALFCYLYLAHASVVYIDIILTLFDPTGLSSKPDFGYITRKEIFSIRRDVLKQPIFINYAIHLYILFVGFLRDNLRPVYVIFKRILRKLSVS